MLFDLTSSGDSGSAVKGLEGAFSFVDALINEVRLEVGYPCKNLLEVETMVEAVRGVVGKEFNDVPQEYPLERGQGLQLVGWGSCQSYRCEGSQGRMDIMEMVRRVD